MQLLVDASNATKARVVEAYAKTVTAGAAAAYGAPPAQAPAVKPVAVVEQFGWPGAQPGRWPPRGSLNRQAVEEAGPPGPQSAWPRRGWCGGICRCGARSRAGCCPRAGASRSWFVDVASRRSPRESPLVIKGVEVTSCTSELRHLTHRNQWVNSPRPGGAVWVAISGAVWVAAGALTCPLQPYQSVGERSRGLQVN